VLDECESEETSFLDADKFVHLLYDDATFRRSRFYFWAIACLTSFEQSIADTLSELAVFREWLACHNKDSFTARVFQVYNAEKAASDETPSPLSFSAFEKAKGDLVRGQVKEYEKEVLKPLDTSIRSQMQKKREEIKFLRDGVSLPLQGSR
jgi:hypothetical protein